MYILLRLLEFGLKNIQHLKERKCFVFNIFLSLVLSGVIIFGQYQFLEYDKKIEANKKTLIQIKSEVYARNAILSNKNHLILQKLAQKCGDDVYTIQMILEKSSKSLIFYAIYICHKGNCFDLLTHKETAYLYDFKIEIENKLYNTILNGKTVNHLSGVELEEKIPSLAPLIKNLGTRQEEIESYWYITGGILENEPSWILSYGLPKNTKSICKNNIDIIKNELTTANKRIKELWETY